MPPLGESPRTQSRRPSAKRALDVLVALTAVVVAAPLLLVIALAVKLTSRGGALFIQPRVGQHEEYFSVLKFRTMVADAPAKQAELEHLNELDGATFAIRDDPRVTPVGRFLRRTSLDELPQFFNVLKGEMSLVGPRPLPERDFLLLPESARVRFTVKPGMTGPAQVSGRNELTFDEMMALDAAYAENPSVLTDLKVLWRTPRVMITGEGAY